MKVKLCSVLIALIFLCTTNVTAQKKKLLTIMENNNGKTFTVSKNQTFKVLFKKECIGCAQTWGVTGIDSTKVKLVSSTNSNKSCKDCTGGTQDHTFTFKALKAGSSDLSFSYFDKQLNVKIQVK